MSRRRLPGDVQSARRSPTWPIAEAASRQGGLDRARPGRVDRSRWAKTRPVPTLDDRLSVLEAIGRHPSLAGGAVTDRQLIADVAAGYDAVVVGADKWLQVVRPGLVWRIGRGPRRGGGRSCPACCWWPGRRIRSRRPARPGRLLLDVDAEHGPSVVHRGPGRAPGLDGRRGGRLRRAHWRRGRRPPVPATMAGPGRWPAS